MQPSRDFRTAVENSRKIERQIARWIMSRGSHVLGVYDYSGANDDKAPKLEIVPPEGSLVLPDLLAARGGRSIWIEVKWKSHANWRRNEHEYQTGFNARLWNHYRRVQDRSGLPVYILFAHRGNDPEAPLTAPSCEGIFSAKLRDLPDPRRSTDRERVHWVNWPIDVMKRIASYREVIADRPEVIDECNRSVVV
jgi:hypothetical protein